MRTYSDVTEGNEVKYLQPVEIVHADVHAGDHADHQEISTRVLEAQQTINEATGEKPDTVTVKSITSDKGYYSVGELQALQQEGIRTVISDLICNRRVDKLKEEKQRAVRGARCSAKSKSGKDLLRRRAMHIERSFAHIPDVGGMRRTTLRGRENLNKRFKLAATIYNLSQLMRKLFGFGIPKRLAAAARRPFFCLSRLLLRLSDAVKDQIAPIALSLCDVLHDFLQIGRKTSPPEIALISTGCWDAFPKKDFVTGASFEIIGNDSLEQVRKLSGYRSNSACLPVFGFSSKSVSQVESFTSQDLEAAGMSRNGFNPPQLWRSEFDSGCAARAPAH